MLRAGTATGDAPITTSPRLAGGYFIRSRMPVCDLMYRACTSR